MTRDDDEDLSCSTSDILPSADRQARAWAMFLHLSVLGGFIVPFGGFVIPILIWRLKRDEFPPIDPHGRALVNWILSSPLYGALLLLVVAFFPGAVAPALLILWVLCVVWLVLPVIAAVRAHQGRPWRYPLAIPFFRVDSTRADP